MLTCPVMCHLAIQTVKHSNLPTAAAFGFLTGFTTGGARALGVK